MTNQDDSSDPHGRRSGRGERPANTSIRSRLTWAVFVPWVVVAVLWAVGCSLFAFDALSAQRVASGVQSMSLPAVNALGQVQRERLRSLEVISEPGLGTDELEAQQRATDSALEELASKSRPVMENAPDDLQAPMNELNGYFKRLPDLRERIASGQATVNELNSFYNDLFDTATRVFDVQARITPDSEATQGARAAVALFQAQDMLAREASMVGTALSTGSLTDAEHRELVGYIAGRETLVQSNTRSMLPGVRQRYDRLTSTADWKRLQSIEDEVVGHGAFSGGNTPEVQVADWRRITNEASAEMAGMVRGQAGRVASDALSRANQTLWTVVIGGVLALVIAIGSFVFARRVYKSVVDDALLTRLQGLRTESLTMAEKLPEVVRRLRVGESVDVEAEVIDMRHYGSDEVGEVAHAIQLFQQEAMQAAAGETRARQGARVVFVGMAHRIQRLLRGMHTTIDHLERDEESSQQLSRLFDLDNSTTRARRTVENLLVLGDQQPGRRWSKPVPLMDVLRSSVSEIDQYSRVVIGHVPDVTVHGAAVGDTIHLISELIDNATAFSPPSTQVHVGATEVARGIAIEISDQGLGMAPEIRERANEMMSSPPEFDRLVLESNKAEQLGLFTAARLAGRRDIGVEFGVSPYGGTRATVLLPDGILEQGVGESSENTGTLRIPAPGEQERTDPAVPRPREFASGGDVPRSAASRSGETPVEWPAAEPAGPSAAAASEQAPETPVMNRRAGSKQSEAQQSASQQGKTQQGQTQQDEPERVGKSAGKGGRPALPKRVPQSHLVDGLKDDPDQEEEQVVAAPSKLAGFRRAFRGGSDDDGTDGSS
ncbi:ATP-binding protein [Saccharopolyspora halophila]|uniref:histidine kinase n=1 Tax=Saccharopolyspora halophila TaxID=405551 RepID=A0ABN3GVJ6_9PSEU